SVEKKVLGLIDEGKFVVTLGGEHSITTGPVRAHAARYKDLSVLQLDAHSDLRPEYEGSPYNHACVMSRVKEVCPCVQVGIRSMCSEEKPFVDDRTMFYAEDIVNGCDWIERVVERLTDNVYVTIDLDVFDPAYLPATGTPEPGGLDWYKVTALLKAVCDRKNVVGFDVMELCPIKSLPASDFLAAKLVYKFLTYKYTCAGSARKRSK
ncbi:MAG: agmatinase, partial [Candidatus Omnitrophica bacterium]|nr:agmatinase [Candidatus Omnitrophota bacterium]